MGAHADFYLISIHNSENIDPNQCNRFKNFSYTQFLNRSYRKKHGKRRIQHENRISSISVFHCARPFFCSKNVHCCGSFHQTLISICVCVFLFSALEKSIPIRITFINKVEERNERYAVSCKSTFSQVSRFSTISCSHSHTSS